MKTFLRSVLLFLLILSVFTSCQGYKVMHYNRDELDNIGGDTNKYKKVYIHDKKNTYLVDKPFISFEGVKGSLYPITDKSVIEEIDNPKTRNQFKAHKYDLNVYTQTEIQGNLNDVTLKKKDVTDVSHIIKHADLGEDIATGAVLGVGVLIWVGIYYSFQGLL